LPKLIEPGSLTREAMVASTLQPTITLPAIQYLSVTSGNENQLKIGEKLPKPIGKEI
jgi:hypothetical protein